VALYDPEPMDSNITSRQSRARARGMLLFSLLAACGPRARAGGLAAGGRGRASSASSPPPTEVCPCIEICIVQQGWLVEIPVHYGTQMGDTLSEDSLPFSHVAPLTGEYAAVAGWYVGDERISFRGRRYRKYGRPRVLAVPEVKRIGFYRWVGVYGEARDTASAERFIYLPYRPGCQFQPYEAVEQRGISGGTPLPPPIAPR